MIEIADARSTVRNENIQEFLDAAASPGQALLQGQAQYTTPLYLARAFANLLPPHHIECVLDPQGADGKLVNTFPGANQRVVFEIDNKITSTNEDRLTRLIGNCVRIDEVLSELFPHAKFPAIVANPPFGLKWKTPAGPIDSTLWTWQFILRRLPNSGFGYLIANIETIKEHGIDKHPWVYMVQDFAPELFTGVGIRIGVVHFWNGQRRWPAVHKVWETNPDEYGIAAMRRYINMGDLYRPCHYNQSNLWETVNKVLLDERSNRPKFNIYMGKDGTLKTYLSTIANIKMKREDIARLYKLTDCHPLTLTTEKETRVLLQFMVDSAIYTIEPAARDAIKDALEQVKSMACPIRPVTDFELVAYADEREKLKCKTAPAHKNMKFTPGTEYDLTTATYTFQDAFGKKVLTFGAEGSGDQWLEDHDMQLVGQDRFVELRDDNGIKWRFMDRPPKDMAMARPESELWDIFEKPTVPTVSDLMPDKHAMNRRLLEMHSMICGFDYYPGQLDYVARVACKDHALVSADTGVGKSLVSLSLIAVKVPARTLIVAPQGTMKSSGDEDSPEYQASQWVQEIRRFAPAEPVFQLFSLSDYRRILHANGGKFPPGIYITYPEAYWSNGAFEKLPDSWNKKKTPLHAEAKFCDRFSLKFDEKNPRPLSEMFHIGVGLSNTHGIRCIGTPSVASILATEQPEWDMVIIDEAHRMCNLDSAISQNMIRLQPKYRFALTATPIPNYVSDIFSLMGWLCVKDWYKGKQLNVAWPFTADDEHRFANTFMSTEIDKTLQLKARIAGEKGWRSKGVKRSPIISSPARLLKLLKPNMAFISKEECNPKQVSCKITDVRVPLGKEQQIVYEHWLNRDNLAAEFPNPMVRALAQMQRLRGVCGSPATVDYGKINLGTEEDPKWFRCKSDFNAKVMTILQLIRDRIAAGEQVVVVNARIGQSDEIARRLSEANIPIARIDSTVNAQLQSAEANRFKKGDARVMLMGIKCAQGHSFDKCHNLIIGSLEWSYGSLHQANGRVWRINSTKEVHVWCVLHENTIEELLFERVATKQDAATICLRGKRVARDYTQADESEILAEHIVNYRAEDGAIMSETECESQWPKLRQELVLAYNPNRRAA